MTCFICCGPPPKRGQKVCDGSCGLCDDCPGKEPETEKLGDGLAKWFREEEGNGER